MVQIDILQFPRKLQKGDPMAGKYYLRAATMFGLDILQSNAIAKMTSIKTTLSLFVCADDWFGGLCVYTVCIYRWGGLFGSGV